MDRVIKKTSLKHLRKRVIEAAYSAKEGHIPSALSVLDILWVLYDQILRIDPETPKDEDRDRFYLSKGHSSLALYSVLAEKGFFDPSALESFCSFSGILGGHPDMNKVPGVEASTGSLGHGFPMAVGAALGLKLQGKKNRVYALVGDGECNEGSIWEAALVASHRKLHNLSLIVDFNHSTDRAIDLSALSSKFESFGFLTMTIDGHDHLRIYEALTLRDESRPVAVIAETTKGYGCSLLENNPAWHHKAPSDAELGILLGALRP